MKIAIDLMGGDLAPEMAVKGIALYFSKAPQKDVSIIGIGNEGVIRPLLERYNIKDKIALVHTDEVIGYNEHPTKAFKEKPKNSISVGFHLLAEGKASAFVSAGNTGAMLVGAMFSIKSIEGILRPAIATVCPKKDGSTGIILDVGLNVDCKPEYLNQFAILGTAYAQTILDIANPVVGLLNVGEEEGKGDKLTKEAYSLLKENKHINFLGNIEGRDLFVKKADVIVCDGFIGNVVLKMGEHIYDIFADTNISENSFFKRFQYQNYGAMPILGVQKPVLIGHGISNDIAFMNMVITAQKVVESNLCTKINDLFAKK
ncbi:MAG: phosphate acyltransferase PlsX [Phycisphaerales bacterium]|nr:phosphate acyltransferase PlsX [Phycisphaerales bacterium]